MTKCLLQGKTVPVEQIMQVWNQLFEASYVQVSSASVPQRRSVCPCPHVFDQQMFFEHSFYARLVLGALERSLIEQ